MRLLKIEFKNINSLKGEHASIDFEKEPLESASIFAILGPTGSGKSTILDVITLALFNKIPRYKKALSKNEIQSSGSVVTHHAKDAMAAVEYEVKGSRYRSEWKIAKNRKDKFNDYEMYLYDDSGRPLDLKKSEVPGKNEAIIGLKYDQFVKSIILSQGEFAKFLKADHNERGKLLEDITGTSIYRKIGKKAYEKNKEVKDSLKLKKELLNNIAILSEEDTVLIKQEIKKITARKNELDKSIKNFIEITQVKKDLQGSITEIEKMQAQKNELEKQKETLKPQISRLSLHNKLNPVKEDIIYYKQAEENKVIGEKNLKEYKEQQVKAHDNRQNCIEEMASLAKLEVDERNFLKVIKTFENEILELDKDIENSIQKGQEIRKRINKQKENYSNALPSKPADALTILKDKSFDLRQILEESPLDEKSNLAEYKSKLKAQKEKHEQLGFMKKDFEEVVKLRKEIEAGDKRLKEIKTNLEKWMPLQRKSNELIESYQQQLSVLRDRREDLIKIASLEEHRAKLTDNQPCPLCGSKEHPYVTHRPESKRTELENHILAVKTELESQETELKKLEKNIIEKEASKNTIEELQQKNNHQITEISKRLSKRKEAFPGSIKEDEIEIKVSELKKNNDALEEGITTLEELRTTLDLLDNFEQLDKAVQEHKELFKKRESKFVGDKIRAVTDELQNRFNEQITNIALLEESIKKEIAALNSANETLEKYRSNLQPKLKAFGFNSIQEMSMHFLPENEVSAIVDKQDELKRLMIANNTKLSEQKSRKEKLIKVDTYPKTSLEELHETLTSQNEEKDSLMGTIGENNQKLESDKQNKEKQKSQIEEISKLEGELEKWGLLNNLIGDATGNKFANFSQGLTLQNLLVYTNQRLKNLSDRYRLDKPESEGQLRVIDIFQGNTHRSVSTLSGGESFLISLALAISLSDMASRNVSIESLFIDEGFSTLDQETLDIAMSTLEKLQSESQKTVGVISHVEALKERITVQIKLEKNAQGFSTVSISEK